MFVLSLVALIAAERRTLNVEHQTLNVKRFCHADSS